VLPAAATSTDSSFRCLPGGRIGKAGAAPGRRFATAPLDRRRRARRIARLIGGRTPRTLETPRLELDGLHGSSGCAFRQAGAATRYASAAATAASNPKWRRRRPRSDIRTLKIATFNINNVNRRLANLLKWLALACPDVVCLQKLKAAQGAFPAGALRDAGYGAVWQGERSWNGVPILARGSEPAITRRALPATARTGRHATSRPTWPAS